MTKFQPVLYKAIKWYYKKPRWVKIKGLNIHLYPTVFHPNLYLSTTIFLDYLLSLPIEKKTVLELGAGNGLIALYLAKNKQCQVTASDINPNAIKGLKENASKNKVELKVVLSDLFDDMPFSRLDFIIVNPPYYPKFASSLDEYAFYCGDNFEYFEKFFVQVLPYLEQQTKVLMILSETAPIAQIKVMAKHRNIDCFEVYKKEKLQESFFVFQLNKLETF